MIDVADLLIELAEEGIALWVEHGRIRYWAARGALTDARRVQIGGSRQLLLDLLARMQYLPLALDRGGWPSDWSEALEERSAIMEYGSCLSRRAAEHQAAGRLRVERLRHVLADHNQLNHVEIYSESGKLSPFSEDEG